MRDKAPTHSSLLEHAEFLRALARSLVLDPNLVDDVVQETWLKALESPPRHAGNLRGWLAAVARRLAFRLGRTAERRFHRERRAAQPDALPSTRQIAARIELQRRVVEAVGRLEEPYRSTIIYRYYDDLAPNEIGSRLGISVKTVKTRLSRALQQLRARLDQDCGGDRRAWSLLLLPLTLPASSASAAGGLAGVVLMSAKAKLLAAASVVLVCALVLWMNLADRDTTKERAARAERATSRQTMLESSAPVPGEAPGTETQVEARAADATRGATIRGTVTAEGRPVSGAYVCLERSDVLVARTYATDTRGRFEFRETGTFTVAAAHPNWGPTTRQVTAKEGETAEVILELPAAYRLDLEVVDAKTGRPVAGAEVLVFRCGSERKAQNVTLDRIIEEKGGYDLLRRFTVFDSLFAPFEAAKGRVFVPPQTTDATGRVRIGGLLPGLLEAVVNHPEYQPKLVQEPFDRRRARLLVELSRGASLRVLAPRFGGKPAIGYLCEVDHPRDPGAIVFRFPVGRARFDERGEALFEALRPGTYQVEVSKEVVMDVHLCLVEDEDESGQRSIRKGLSVNRYSGVVLLRRRVTVREGEPTLLDLSAVAGATIKGRLVADPPVDRPWQVGLLGGPHQTGEVAVTDTDAEGAFRFERIMPGKYRVVARTLRGRGGLAAKECVIGRSDDEVSVVLHLTRAEVSGLVTGPNGNPLGKAMVSAILKNRAAAAALQGARGFDVFSIFATSMDQTDADGTFRLEGVPAGDYYLFCGGERHLARQELSLADGEHRRIDIRLDATHLHRLTVRLVDEQGAPVSGSVVVRGEVGGLLTAVAPGDDVLLAEEPAHTFWLARGRYFLDVYAEDKAPQRNSAVDVAGNEDVALRLQKGVRATLVLESAKGPLAQRRIVIRDENGWTASGEGLAPSILLPPAGWRTDGKGRVVVPHLLPGRYIVHVDGREVGTFRVGRDPVDKRFHVPPILPD